MKYPMLARVGGCHSVFRHERAKEFIAPLANDDAFRDIAAEITGERYKTGFGATRPTINTGPRVSISSAYPKQPVMFSRTLKDAFGGCP